MIIFKKDKDVDILSSPKDAFWQLSKPMIALSFFGEIYALGDMFWISKVSPEAFFAVGLCIPLFTLMGSLGRSLGYGTNSVISRYLGLGNDEEAYNLILHGIVGGFVIWIFILFASFFLKDILSLMGVNEAMGLAIAFLQPIFVFSFVFIFQVLFAQTLQAEGNSRLPTILGISANALNLILDPIFIFVFNWGVGGVAYATVISAVIPIIVCLYWYKSGRTKVRLTWSNFKPGISLEILLVAVPSFLMDSVVCIGSMFVNRILIEQLGQIGVVLYSTANRIANVLLSADTAYSWSISVISGHLFGAHRIDKLKEIYSYSIKMSMFTALGLVILFFFVRDWGFAIFSVTNMSQAVFYITLAGIPMLPFMGAARTSVKVLTGTGKSYWSFIFTLAKVVFQILLIWALYSAFPNGVCVLISILVSEVVSSIAFYILINKIFLKYDNNEVATV